jgi:C1A family cysteine protease
MFKPTVLFYVVLLLSNAIISVSSLSKSKVDAAFETFKKTYNKSYANRTVEEYRKQVFSKNLDHIDDINDKASTFVVGVTQFTDNTHEEIKRNLLTYRADEEEDIPGGVIITSLLQSKKLKNRSRQGTCFLANNALLANTVDYTVTATLSPIRDQGWCGCCWAFATVFQLEYYYWKKTGQQKDFSVQTLVDCNAGNFACDGGTLSKAVSFHQTWTVTDAVTYPYIDGKGTCNFAAANAVQPSYRTILSSPMTLLKASTDNIINALIKNGPLLTSVDSTYLPFYVSGIFDPAPYDYDCLTANHAVNIVGAGIDPDTGKVYYKIRNSWGDSWGENGYFRIYACVCQIGVRAMYATMK